MPAARGDAELSLLRIQAVFAERGRGAMSLETRWMLPGPLPNSMVKWLGPFADAIERRVDRYLIHPSNEELGVKIRGVILLDLKSLRGSPGTFATYRRPVSAARDLGEVVLPRRRGGTLARQRIELAYRSEGATSAFVPFLLTGKWSSGT